MRVAAALAHSWHCTSARLPLEYVRVIFVAEHYAFGNGGAAAPSLTTHVHEVFADGCAQWLPMGGLPADPSFNNGTGMQPADTCAGETENAAEITE